MKYCSSCEQMKPVSEFNKDKGRYDGLQTYCRDCRKQIDKKYYQRNPEKQAVRNKQTVMRNRRQAYLYLKQHPCVDCGIKNPLVLTFDHVKGTKKHAIARMIDSCVSWNTILDEIEKCVVRCFNCHMIKTSQERGWHKLRFILLEEFEKLEG